MISKNDIKQIQSLAQKKFRKELGVFVVEGEKMVEELIKSDFTIEKLYATEDFEQIHPKLEKIKQSELERITHLKTPNKVLAVVRLPEAVQEADYTADFTLVLDGISDPGNLGTLIRIADWFGIKNIVCSSDTVDVFNPKVVQSTMGSLFRIKIKYVDLVEFFDQHRAVPVIGTLLNGKNLFETPLESPAFVLMGSESHGISDALLPFVTQAVTIPGKGEAESLNVAVAAGIVCSKLRY